MRINLIYLIFCLLASCEMREATSKPTEALPLNELYINLNTYMGQNYKSGSPVYFANTSISLFLDPQLSSVVTIPPDTQAQFGTLPMTLNTELVGISSLLGNGEVSAAKNSYLITFQNGKQRSYEVDTTVNFDEVPGEWSKSQNISFTVTSPVAFEPDSGQALISLDGNGAMQAQATAVTTAEGATFTFATESLAALTPGKYILQINLTFAEKTSPDTETGTVVSRSSTYITSNITLSE